MPPRLSDRSRRTHYGPPARDAAIRTVELWGQRIRVHHRVADHLIRTAVTADRILSHLDLAHLRPRRVDGYVPRMIAGTSSWSLHAYGLAVDIFRTPPGVVPPGGVWTPRDQLHQEFVAVWELAGWTWGGRWRRRDTPHFEWATYPP